MFSDYLYPSTMNRTVGLFLPSSTNELNHDIWNFWDSSSPIPHVSPRDPAGRVSNYGASVRANKTPRKCTPSRLLLLLLGGMGARQLASVGGYVWVYRLSVPVLQNGPL